MNISYSDRLFSATHDTFSGKNYIISERRYNYRTGLNSQYVNNLYKQEYDIVEIKFVLKITNYNFNRKYIYSMVDYLYNISEHSTYLFSLILFYICMRLYSKRVVFKFIDDTIEIKDEKYDHLYNDRFVKLLKFLDLEDVKKVIHILKNVINDNSTELERIITQTYTHIKIEKSKYDLLTDERRESQVKKRDDVIRSLPLIELN